VRILVLNQYFHPDSSATSQLLTECCEDLAGEHEVHVVTGRPSYDPTVSTGSKGIVSHERHGEVHVERVWSTAFHRSGLVGRMTNYLTYLTTSVLGGLSVKRPDVVIALTDPPPVGVVGVVVARIRRAPFVLVTQDIHPEVAVRIGALKNSAVISGLRLTMRFLFLSATRVVSIGRDMNERLAELGVPASKVVLIHNWSDQTLVRPLDGPSRLRQREGWGDRLVVMHSGNVGMSQGIDWMVDAADRLRETPDVLLAIVGEGSAKASLEADVNRRGLTNVVFLPYQPKEELSDSLGAADVHLVGLRSGLAGYIVPSKVYGILAAGRPFIAAVENGSEPARIIAEERCGMHVQPGDSAAIAEAILKLRAMSPSERQEMGLRGRAGLVERYDRTRASALYERLLHAIVDFRR
jgi:colanic acid biosynthesis glycosyl transferase WcaI